MYSGYSTATLIRAKSSFSYTHISVLNERAADSCCTGCSPSPDLSIYALPIHPKFLYAHCLRQSALIQWSPSRSFLSAAGPRCCRTRASYSPRYRCGSYRELIGLFTGIEGIGCSGESSALRRLGWSSSEEHETTSLVDEGDRQHSRREDVSFRATKHRSSLRSRSSFLDEYATDSIEQELRKGGRDARPTRTYAYPRERDSREELESRLSEGTGARASSSRNGSRWEASGREEREARGGRERYIGEEERAFGRRDSREGSRKHISVSESHEDGDLRRASRFNSWEHCSTSNVKLDESEVERSESRRSSQKFREIYENRHDEKRVSDSKRYSEQTNMKDRVDGTVSVGNSVKLARDRRNQEEEHVVDKMEVKQQNENRTDVSRIQDSTRLNSRQSIVETGSNDRAHHSSSAVNLVERISDSKRYSQQTSTKDRVDASISVNNSVQLARDRRNQMERRATDRMEVSQQYKNRTDVSQVQDSEKLNNMQSIVATGSDVKEHHSSSTVNQFRGEREQHNQIEEHLNRQYSSRRLSERETKLSELSRSEIERIARSQEMYDKRMEREDHSTSVVNIIDGRRDQQNQVSNQVDLRYESRSASDRNAKLSDSSARKVAQVSSSQEISTMSSENQEKNSSLALVRDKKDRQKNTQVGESSQSKKTQTIFSGSDGTSSLPYSYIHELDDQTRKDGPYLPKGDRLDSASQLDKSSMLYVEEFVDQIREEMSVKENAESASTHTSEIRTAEVRRGTKQTTSDAQVGALDCAEIKKQKKEESARRSSSRSGMKGPSDEMWDVRGSYSQESSKIEEPDQDSSPGVDLDSTATPARTENSITRRSHRSLWIYLSDIIRIGWGQRAESQDLISKSGKKSSSNESISSEAWFSGHEPDENDNESRNKGKSVTPKEPVQIKKHVAPDPSHIRTHSAPSQESSEPSGPGYQVILSETSSATSRGNIVKYPQFKDASPISKPEVMQWAEGEKGRQSAPGAVIYQQPSPLVSGIVSAEVEEEITQIGSAQTPGSSFGKLEEEQELLGTKLTDIGGTESNSAELKRRKLQRNKQVLKERFDEWEDAYKHETERRKTDEYYMREALLEAKKAADTWEVPVGAVLVHNGKIIARGCNLVEELRDSTAHAEMICIREASSLLKTWRLAETTLYVTLEPCAMCAGAILQARVDTVVWGAPNKLLGADGSWVRLFPGGDGGSNSLDPTNQTMGPVHPFHPKIEIRRGILAAECADAMQQFFQLRRKNKKQESPPPSCLPISTRPTKLFGKMHDLFCIMFCL